MILSLFEFVELLLILLGEEVFVTTKLCGIDIILFTGSSILTLFG